MALLYVDLLGTAARFDDGLSSARAGIRVLELLVVETLEELDMDPVVRGNTETDSAAPQFARADEAIEFGIAL